VSAPTAAKKRAPKKTAVEIPAPDVSAVEIPDGPVVIGKEGKAAPVRHDLFEVDGVMYSMPEPTIGHVLKYLKTLRKSGRDLAAQDIGFDLLGEDALDALSNSPDASQKDIERVFTRVGAIFFGSSAYKSVTASAGN
jgi:hypothetical protein